MPKPETVDVMAKHDRMDGPEKARCRAREARIELEWFIIDSTAGFADIRGLRRVVDLMERAITEFNQG